MCVGGGCVVVLKVTTFLQHSMSWQFRPCVMIRYVALFFLSSVVPCTQPVYMRCPLFFPPPHPTPSLTSLSRNEILSLFLPDPAELVFMGGKRAPLDAAGKSIVISEHGYIREWLYQSMVISENGNIRSW